MDIDTQSFEYADGNVDLIGYFIWDKKIAERRPGILIVHGGAGLDDHAKTQAERFSKLGYVTFACDMYGKGVPGNRQLTMALLEEFRANPVKLSKRAQLAVDVLKSHLLVDGRIIAVGYCFGGMAVLELARHSVELSGVVSVHGTLSTIRPSEPGAIKARVLVCHGALDPHITLPQVNTFVDEMTRAGADWQIIIYGGAKHGFTHEGISAFPGVEYHPESDARSFNDIKSFIVDVLGTNDVSRQTFLT